MRIDVRSGNALVDREMLAYAEYRVFVGVQRFASRIESIAIEVREVPHLQGRGAECDICARLLGAGQVRIRSKGSHLAAAIDRAAARLECEMASKVASPVGFSPNTSRS